MSGAFFRGARSILVVAGLVAATSTGCAAASGAEPDDEQTGTTEQAITNGDDDDDDPAVVALLLQGQVFCTGVLLTSHVVATAAHCVSVSPPDQVYFGSKPSTKTGTFIAVADTLAHPDFDEDTLANDIGLVALADKAPIAPLPVLTQEFDKSFVKLPLRLVGFGAPAANDDGNVRKRVGTTTIESYTADTFKFLPGPSQTCNGDSGGPAFATVGGKEYVVGLTSSGDANCKQYGSDVRVDRFVPFITGYAKAYSAKIASASGNASSKGCSLAPEARSNGAPLGVLLAVTAAAAAARARRARS